MAVAAANMLNQSECCCGGYSVAPVELLHTLNIFNEFVHKNSSVQLATFF